ncbi:MAG: N-acetylmuramidase family protein, partial [bacterium]|nr:N-acetylmuramidase family protein [bacterium]
LRVQLLIQSGYASGNYIQEISGGAPKDIPAPGDPLKPPANEFIPIQHNFSTEQKTMATTWNQYGGLIKQVASQYSLNPIVALAVLCVESGGKGFGSDGRMIIRFENHYFYNYWGSKNESLYQNHFRYDPTQTWRGHEYRMSPSSAWMPVHTEQQYSEWQVFQFASQFDRTAAMKSISMGSPQIMGANYSILGYSSVDQMYNDFKSDIRNQIIGLFRYIKGKNLVPVLVAEDFVSFARVYNGPANASTYGAKIKKHVDEFRRIFPFS